MTFCLDSRNFRLAVCFFLNLRVNGINLSLLYSVGGLLLRFFSFARCLLLLSYGGLLRGDDFFERAPVVVARSVRSAFLFRLKRYGGIVPPSTACSSSGGGSRCFFRRTSRRLRSCNLGGVSSHLRRQVRWLLCSLRLRLQIIQLIHGRGSNCLRLLSLRLRCGISRRRRRSRRLFLLRFLDRNFIVGLLLLLRCIFGVTLRFFARRLEFFLQSFNLLRRSFVFRNSFRGRTFRRFRNNFFNFFFLLLVRVALQIGFIHGQNFLWRHLI